MLINLVAWPLQKLRSSKGLYYNRQIDRYLIYPELACHSRTNALSFETSMSTECAFAQPGIDTFHEITRLIPRNTKVISDVGDTKTKFTTVGNAIEKSIAEIIEIGSSTPVNTLERSNIGGIEINSKTLINTDVRSNESCIETRSKTF